MSLKLTDIDMEDQIDDLFISEILLNFDQILKVTIGIWQNHNMKVKQTMAAINMKPKMMPLEVASTSTATALTIAKATEAIDTTKLLVQIQIFKSQTWKSQ
jgi:predicted LPLAT superfamily acyltransferase